MCLSCGCKQPNERHGDDRNIVMQDLQDAAQASNISENEVVKNIQEGYQDAGGAQERQEAGQKAR